MRKDKCNIQSVVLLPEHYASTIKRIMADIYGTQHGFVEELGLADALDPDDFDVKLASLKESGHRLQKKFLSDEGNCTSDVIKVNKFLGQWVEEFYSEAVRALRGFGRYRLADGYEHFL